MLLCIYIITPPVVNFKDSVYCLLQFLVILSRSMYTMWIMLVVMWITMIIQIVSSKMLHKLTFVSLQYLIYFPILSNPHSCFEVYFEI